MLADLPVASLELRRLLGMRWRVSLIVTAAAAVATAINGHTLEAGALGSWGFFLGTLCGFQRARFWFRDARRAEYSTILRLVPAPGIRSAAALVPAAAVALTALAVLEVTGQHGSVATLVPTVVCLCGIAAGFDFACAVVIGEWEARTGYCIARPHPPRPRLRGRELSAVPAPGRMRATPRLPHAIAALCVVGVMCAGAAAGTLTSSAVDLPPSPAVSRVHPSLSAVVRQLTGHTTPVTCWSQSDWQTYQNAYRQQVAGIASGGRIYLAPTPCRWLMWMRTTHGWPGTHDARFWMAEAAGVLTHESGHIALGSNETNAECFAYDNVDHTLMLLGYSPAQAEELVRIYRTESYPQLPPSYRERPC